MPYKDLQKKKLNDKKYRLDNLEKFTAYQKEQYQKTKNSSRKNYNLMKSFNISLDEYNTLFDSQKGCCAICGRHQVELKRKLAVDHCHTTGKIRSLLCVTCNTHLGIYEKYKELFDSYLNERK